MWEEKLLIWLKPDECGLNTRPTLESYEVDQGTGVCVYVCVCVLGQEWVFLVDAHHMGSCGPRASVGGWAPVGTGPCCNRSDPWRPAAAAAGPAVWRSSSSPPSDWTSPLQGKGKQMGEIVRENIENSSEWVCRSKEAKVNAATHNGFPSPQKRGLGKEKPWFPPSSSAHSCLVILELHNLINVWICTFLRLPEHQI